MSNGLKIRNFMKIKSLVSQLHDMALLCLRHVRLTHHGFPLQHLTNEKKQMTLLQKLLMLYTNICSYNPTKIIFRWWRFNSELWYFDVSQKTIPSPHPSPQKQIKKLLLALETVNIRTAVEEKKYLCWGNVSLQPKLNKTGQCLFFAPFCGFLIGELRFADVLPP